jgi:HEAT repeat protein
LEQGALALDPTLIETLSTLDVEGMDAALRRGFDVADELVRPALMSALLARGDAAALGALRGSLADTDPLVRMEAVHLLAQVNTAETQQLLSRAVSGSDTPEGQVAVLVLAAWDGGAFKVFEDAFEGDNRDVRQMAIRYGAEHVMREEVRGAARTARKRLEKLLAPALVDLDPSMREEALRQTGRLQMAGLQSVVEAILNDKEADDQVRICAVEALIFLVAASEP